MGPVISAESREFIVRTVTETKPGRCRDVVDGRDLVVPGHEEGLWVGHMVIDHVKTEMNAYTEEIFVPSWWWSGWRTWRQAST